tara:strand:+ start:1332 stop:1523 length:192 start_codon:yes stop_codon:yes gene_type:complete
MSENTNNIVDLKNEIDILKEKVEKLEIENTEMKEKINAYSFVNKYEDLLKYLDKYYNVGKQDP